MLGASLKRKISRYQHPAHAQPSGSDDEEPVGALGAYNRLLELSARAVSPLDISAAVPRARRTLEQDEPEEPGEEAYYSSRVYCMSTSTPRAYIHTVIRAQEMRRKIAR
jgi:hypothetical protein